MKKILLLMLLSLILTINVSNLTAQNDYLEPVKGIFERTNIGYNIDSLIRKNYSQRNWLVHNIKEKVAQI